jgi:hypothetical protein
MPSLTTGKTEALKKTPYYMKDKAEICSNVTNTASPGPQIFYIKAICFGKMIQHECYGSAFTVGEYIFLSKYVPYMYNCTVLRLGTYGPAAQWMTDAMNPSVDT